LHQQCPPGFHQGQAGLKAAISAGRRRPRGV